MIAGLAKEWDPHDHLYPRAGGCGGETCQPSGCHRRANRPSLLSPLELKTCMGWMTELTCFHWEGSVDERRTWVSDTPTLIPSMPFQFPSLSQGWRWGWGLS